MKSCVTLLRSFVLVTLTALLVSGCTPLHYGRLTPLSETERLELNCHDLKIEIAKAQEFLNNLSEQRSTVSGAHVLGAVRDLGINNMLEGEAAQDSGQKRLRDLQNVAAAKRCKS